MRIHAVADSASPANSANSACFFSRKSQTAVDSQRLAGDEVRARGEKKHGLRHIGGRTIAAHGCFGGETRGLAAIGSV